MKLERGVILLLYIADTFSSFFLPKQTQRVNGMKKIINKILKKNFFATIVNVKY